MSDPEHARMLLELARRDLQALAGMKDAATFADEIFGFHAQQTVEKALKAWLSQVGVAYPKTHDLEQLMGLLQDNRQTVPEQFRGLTDLTDYAVQWRYEAFDSMGEALDRVTTIQSVTELVCHIEQVVSGS